MNVVRRLRGSAVRDLGLSLLFFGVCGALQADAPASGVSPSTLRSLTGGGVFGNQSLMDDEESQNSCFYCEAIDIYTYESCDDLSQSVQNYTGVSYLSSGQKPCYPKRVFYDFRCLYGGINTSSNCDTDKNDYWDP